MTKERWIVVVSIMMCAFLDVFAFGWYKKISIKNSKRKQKRKAFIKL